MVRCFDRLDQLSYLIHAEARVRKRNMSRWERTLFYARKSFTGIVRVLRSSDEVLTFLGYCSSNWVFKLQNGGETEGYRNDC